MSGITKCTGRGCPVKELCKRFMAPPDPIWQSYMDPPKDPENCPMWWPYENRRPPAGTAEVVNP